jgi:hypothetical protein
MRKNSVAELKKTEGSSQTEILREGARKMLAMALEV